MRVDFLKMISKFLEILWIQDFIQKRYNCID